MCAPAMMVGIWRRYDATDDIGEATDRYDATGNEGGATYVLLWMIGEATDMIEQIC